MPFLPPNQQRQSTEGIALPLLQENEITMQVHSCLIISVAWGRVSPKEKNHNCTKFLPFPFLAPPFLPFFLTLSFTSLFLFPSFTPSPLQNPAMRTAGALLAPPDKCAVRTIDVKKTLFTFFLFWSRFLRFVTFFNFPNVFLNFFRKNWQSSERQAE